MPERVYIDLGGGDNIPAETWAGATTENVKQVLFKGSSHPAPETLSLRELLSSQAVPPLTDAARLLLEELAPDAILHREAQLAEAARSARSRA